MSSRGELDRLGDRERARLAGATRAGRTGLARPVHDRAERHDVERVDLRRVRAAAAVDDVALTVAREELVGVEVAEHGAVGDVAVDLVAARRRRRRGRRRRCPRRCRCPASPKTRSSPPSPARLSPPSPPWISSPPPPAVEVVAPGGAVEDVKRRGAVDLLEVRADVVALGAGAVVGLAVEADRHAARVALEHELVGALAAAHRVRALVVVTPGAEAEAPRRSGRRPGRRPRRRCRGRP